MEPRPYERGNAKSYGAAIYETYELQWSHVLTNVETVQSPDMPAGKDAASMEPRPYERGNRERR